MLLKSLSPKAMATQSFIPLCQEPALRWGIGSHAVALPALCASGCLPRGAQLSLGSISWPHLDSSLQSPAQACRKCSRDTWTGMELATPFEYLKVYCKEMGQPSGVYDKWWQVYLNQRRATSPFPVLSGDCEIKILNRPGCSP